MAWLMPQPEQSLLNHRTSFSIQSLAAGAIGNLLEWYDFGLYGFLAPVIGRLFFPSHDHVASLMFVYGGFAIGFAVRPLGGVVFGHIGDRIGRHAVLILSVVLMGAATTLIGFLPTYKSIGIAAPLLLLMVRIFQGFSVGGEFTGSVAYLVETAPRGHRGFAGSFANIGSMGGSLLAAAVAALTLNLASKAALDHGVWRAPFLIGGVIAIFAIIIRSRLTETGYQPEAETAPKFPLKEAFVQNPRLMIVAMLFTAGYGVSFYLSMVFLPSFAGTFGDISVAQALPVNTVAQALALILVPLSGWLTDHVITRRSMLILAFGSTLVLAIPAFILAHGGGIGGFWAAQLALGIAMSFVMGAEPAMMTEIFPSKYRLSGYSVAFNIGLGIAGGTAPIVVLGLIKLTGIKIAPSWYLVFGAALAAGAIALLQDRSREPLR